MSLPSWPLTHRGEVPTSGGRAFGARRSDGARHHAGIDLAAIVGDEVLATEDGRVVATQPFNGPRAHAILVEMDSGVVVLYGEVEPHSWGDFGIGIGSRVVRGQKIARVGVNPGGSSMLHFELYHRGTRMNERWLAGHPMPANLIDPTGYLVLASSQAQDDSGEDATSKSNSAALILLIAGLISYFYKKWGR